MTLAVYAADTSVERLVDEYLPILQRTADNRTEEWTLVQSLPQSEAPSLEYPWLGPESSPISLDIVTVESDGIEGRFTAT
jgi:hypothetical protein